MSQVPTNVSQSEIELETETNDDKKTSEPVEKSKTDALLGSRRRNILQKIIQKYGKGGEEIPEFDENDQPINSDRTTEQVPVSQKEEPKAEQIIKPEEPVANQEPENVQKNAPTSGLNKRNLLKKILAKYGEGGEEIPEFDEHGQQINSDKAKEPVPQKEESKPKEIIKLEETTPVINQEPENVNVQKNAPTSGLNKRNLLKKILAKYGEGGEQIPEFDEHGRQINSDKVNEKDQKDEIKSEVHTEDKDNAEHPINSNSSSQSQDIFKQKSKLSVDSVDSAELPESKKQLHRDMSQLLFQPRIKKDEKLTALDVLKIILLKRPEYFIIVFNTLSSIVVSYYLVTGITVATWRSSIDLITNKTDSKYVTFNNETLDTAFSAAVLLGVSLSNFANIIFGCSATISGHKYQLIMHMVFQVILLLTEFINGLVLGNFASCNRGLLRDPLTNLYNRYGNLSESSQRFIDTMQASLACCGVDDYNDFAQAKFKTRAGSFYVIPNSCCTPVWIRNIYCSIGVDEWIGSTDNDTAERFTKRINQKGCEGEIHHLCESVIRLSGNGSLIFAGIHLFISCLEIFYILRLLQRIDQISNDAETELAKTDGADIRHVMSTTSITSIGAKKVSFPLADERKFDNPKSEFIHFKGQYAHTKVGEWIRSVHELTTDPTDLDERVKSITERYNLPKPEMYFLGPTKVHDEAKPIVPEKKKSGLRISRRSKENQKNLAYKRFKTRMKETGRTGRTHKKRETLQPEDYFGVMGSRNPRHHTFKTYGQIEEAEHHDLSSEVYDPNETDSLPRIPSKKIQMPKKKVQWISYW